MCLLLANSSVPVPGRHKSDMVNTGSPRIGNTGFSGRGEGRWWTDKDDKTRGRGVGSDKSRYKCGTASGRLEGVLADQPRR